MGNIKKIICQICGSDFTGYKNRKFCDICRDKRRRLSARFWAKKNYDKDISREKCYAWRKKNKDKYSALMQSWRNKNRLKIREYQKQLREKHLNENPCKVHLRQAKNRCTAKDNLYYRHGIKCHLTIKDIQYLWDRDKAYLLFCPSLDRKNSSKNYTLKNCRFIECYKNCNRNKPK